MQLIQDGIRYNRIADGQVAVAGFGIQISRSKINIPAYTKNGYKVVMISPDAFSENEELEEVCLPVTITCIGERAFYKCKNLTTVNLLDDEYEHVTTTVSVHEKAFYKCKKLFKFTAHKKIELCGESVFKDCILLPKLNCEICGNLPNKCFASCLSLSEFHFCDKSMKVEVSCFDECLNLKHFYIEADLDLTEEFFNNFQNCMFHCHENSKYFSLAYRGYHVKRIYPRV